MIPHLQTDDSQLGMQLSIAMLLPWPTAVKAIREDLGSKWKPFCALRAERVTTWCLSGLTPWQCWSVLWNYWKYHILQSRALKSVMDREPSFMCTVSLAHGKANPSRFYNETCHLWTILFCKEKISQPSHLYFRFFIVFMVWIKFLFKLNFVCSTV